MLERMTYRTAQQVLSTNESYRRVAPHRGEVPARCTDGRAQRSRHSSHAPGAAHAAGARQVPALLVYLGIMGPQDGVDTVLASRQPPSNHRGRTEVRAVLMGFGDCLEDLRRLCTELDLDDWSRSPAVWDRPRSPSTSQPADIGLCPDPKTPLNDVSTMNKTMEYMAYCLPSVSFDLAETRVSAGDTALYAPSGDLDAFADAVERLLDDDDLRVSMGLAARARVASQLDWREQAKKYVAVFERALGPSGGHPRMEATASAGAQRELVDLDDADRLEEFIRDRFGRLDRRETA